MRFIRIPLWVGGLLTAILPAASQVPQVKINEVYYDAPTGWAEPYNEWVELYNAGSTSVDLSNWIFTDDPNLSSSSGEGYFTIPSGTQIDPHGFLILCSDSDTFITHWTPPAGVPIVPYGPYDQGTIALSNTGDDIHLFMPDGQGGDTLVDETWYGSGGDMGSTNAAPDVAAGHSLGRFPNGNDTDNPSADFLDYTNPNPGTSNPDEITEALSLVHAHSTYRWLPARALLEWSLPLTRPYRVMIYRPDGRRITSLLVSPGTRRLSLASWLSSSGVYLVLLEPTAGPPMKILWLRP